MENRIYIWQSQNGRLLRVLDDHGHSQKVTCLEFSHDGSQFVSAGKDGNVLVWSLLEVIARKAIPGQTRDQIDTAMPRFGRSDHKMEVTDLHITSGGIKSRIYSSSLDQTCKICCLASGRLLLDIHVGSRLHSVVVDAEEKNLFLGTETGDIAVFDILCPPRDIQMTRSKDNCRFFKGHKDAVKCISVAMDGVMLASGADDHLVKLWDIKSGECLRSLEHKAKLTSVRFILPFASMLKPEMYKQSLTLTKSLQKTIADSDGNVEVFVRHEIEVNDVKKVNYERKKRSLESTNEESVNGKDDAEEVKRLKQINLNLYRSAMKHVIK